jgi:hypothetical protein
MRQFAPLFAAQLVWWSAVLNYIPGAVAALIAQLYLTRRWDREALPDLPFFCVVVSSGLLLDALTVQLDVVQFRSASLFGLPAWLMLLWLSFALTVPRLQRLLPQPAVQTVVLASAATLAYLGGAAFSTATILQPARYAALLLLGWSLLLCLWRWVAEGFLTPLAHK